MSKRHASSYGLVLLMMELRQCGIQTIAKVAAWRRLTVYCAVLVLMRLQSTTAILRGLGDMWCLEYPRGK